MSHRGSPDLKVVTSFLRNVDATFGTKLTPRVCVSENEEHMELSVDVSAMPPGHFRAEVENGFLIIRTAGESEPTIPGAGYYMGSDRVFCTVPIDEPVEVESVNASYSGDTLRITYVKRKN